MEKGSVTGCADNYQRGQHLLILLCCFAFGVAYAGRCAYSANISNLMNDYQITRADAGAVGTVYFVAYGVSQLLHAALCRFYPRRTTVPIALFLSAGVYVVMLFRLPFPVIKCLWFFKGICQSLLWPALLLVLGETLGKSMMNRAVLAMSLSSPVGAALGYGGSILFSFGAGYRFSFLFVALISFGVGAEWLLSYRKIAAKRSCDAAPSDGLRSDNGFGKRNAALLWLLLLFAFLAAVDYFVKDGLNLWTPTILGEMLAFSDRISMIVTLILSCLGVFGTVLALRGQRMIKDYRALLGAFFFVLAVVFGFLLLFLHFHEKIPFLLCFGVVFVLTESISNVLTSMIPFAFRKKVNTGFLAGFVSASSYVGSMVSAYGLGWISDCFGWNAVVLVFLCVCGFAAVLAGAAYAVAAVCRKRKV